MPFSPGDQIAYIPTHAEGNIHHKDVEFGFVTSVSGDTVYCRYWSKYSPNELRTKANSEGAHKSLIRKHVSRSQSKVKEAMDSL